MNTLSRDTDPRRPWYRRIDWSGLMVLGGIALVAMGISSLIGKSFDRQIERQHERYAVWQKLTGRTDLTYDEFVIAYDARLLTVKP